MGRANSALVQVHEAYAMSRNKLEKETNFYKIKLRKNKNAVKRD